jgi:hypothetical protein
VAGINPATHYLVEEPVVTVKFVALAPVPILFRTLTGPVVVPVATVNVSDDGLFTVRPVT